ncbi:iron-sulfur cluster assembly protein CIA1 KNAG_0C06240 [Huiozyma naganishii CBS 8797]|uniref:Probable cytosolic iron-sulfur protein assembly protein 1 n=1 Tax=Huiozyma naganishii (strain ATCC MYA-139 / BCRC 22969 / CBS 8797 / KCTC 17520 / NBRC 10181 / NCYC 3082 / Yp74L-3) TaxID=1071383 RepID=J7R4E3_HUIN7|nr:hypothetical protein KNAG_0C06240 [Kazachstania naganishii CBS 8797]CCK69720.1 hypothetical protein KNAG_0C06240 [Kazachstania naganishii CBS 8797]
MAISLIRSLKLQNGKTWALDFTPQGNKLAIASEDHKIKLVEIESLEKKQFKLVNVLDDTVHKKAVRTVAWRPHSNPPCLAAGSFDTTVSIWSFANNDNAIEDDDDDDDAGAGLEANEMDLMAIIEGHENEIKGIAWSHDGMFLATCSRDKSVWIWETDEMGEDFECVSVLQEHSQDVKDVTWHPSKYLLASSSYDDSVRIWSEFDDDWECVAVLNGHEGTVWCSDFAKDNSEETRLCSASDDSTVRVWKCVEEEPDGQQQWICESVLPKAHERQIYSVSWSDDGLIASTGSDGSIVVYKESAPAVWEVVETRKLAHTVYEVNEIKWIKVNGRNILVTAGDDGCINVWDFQVLLSQ